jgi:hypothetical protein
MESSERSDSSSEEERPVPPADSEPEDRIVILDEEGKDITSEVYRPSDLFD